MPIFLLVFILKISCVGFGNNFSEFILLISFTLRDVFSKVYIVPLGMIVFKNVSSNIVVVTKEGILGFPVNSKANCEQTLHYNLKLKTFD